MSDFKFDMVDGKFRLKTQQPSFRPSGKLESQYWTVFWISSQSATKPSKRFFDALERNDPAAFVDAWDFAFVAQHKRQTLAVIARDALGLVALRYTSISGGIRWFTGPEVDSSDINPRRLRPFVRFEPDFSREDFFEGVYRLKPGELVVCDGFASRSFDGFPSPSVSISTDELERSIVDLLKTSVPESDAYTLSGGLDSTALVAIAGQKAKSAWTVKYPERTADETEEAKQSAETLNVEWKLFDASAVPALHSESFFQSFHTGYGPWFVPATQTELAFFQHIADHSTGEIVTGVGADQVLHSNADVAVREALQNAQLGEVSRALLRNPKKTIRQIGTTAVKTFVGDGEKTWSNIRRDELNAWAWESTVRQIELYARTVGRSFSTPWLVVPLWQKLLRATPNQLRLNQKSKGLAKSALRGIVPDDIRTAPKRKGPNKFVERGLAIDGKASILTLWDAPLLPNVLDSFSANAFRSRFGSWCDQVEENYPDGPYQPTLPIWKPIAAELWLRSLKG